MGTHVRRSSISGLGTFATGPIEVGTTVFSFKGPQEPLSRLGLRYWYLGNDGPSSVQIGSDAFLLLPRERDANHSCAPNAGIDGDLDLVALQDIAPGQEILWDYSTTMDVDGWSMPECRCGSAACRGTIGPFKTLPPEVALRYCGLGIVPDYCARHFGMPGWPTYSG